MKHREERWKTKKRKTNDVGPLIHTPVVLHSQFDLEIDDNEFWYQRQIKLQRKKTTTKT